MIISVFNYQSPRIKTKTYTDLIEASRSGLETSRMEKKLSYYDPITSGRFSKNVPTGEQFNIAQEEGAESLLDYDDACELLDVLIEWIAEWGKADVPAMDFDIWRAKNPSVYFAWGSVRAPTKNQAETF